LGVSPPSVFGMHMRTPCFYRGGHVVTREHLVKLFEEVEVYRHPVCRIEFMTDAIDTR